MLHPWVNRAHPSLSHTHTHTHTRHYNREVLQLNHFLWMIVFACALTSFMHTTHVDSLWSRRFWVRTCPRKPYLYFCNAVIILSWSVTASARRFYCDTMQQELQISSCCKLTSRNTSWNNLESGSWNVDSWLWINCLHYQRMNLTTLLDFEHWHEILVVFISHTGT